MVTFKEKYKSDFYTKSSLIIQNNSTILEGLKNDIEVYLKNLSFINKYADDVYGKDVFIIGSGPSINSFDFQKYNSDNVIKMGVNGQIFNEKFKLDYFFASDYVNLKKKEITADVLNKKAHEGVRICLGRNINRTLPIKKSKYYIADEFIAELEPNVNVFYYTNDYKEVINRSYTKLLYAFFTAGHLPLLFSLYCGAKRIFLIGFDQGGNFYADGSLRTKSVNDQFSPTNSDLKVIHGFKNVIKISDFLKHLGYSSSIYSVNPVNMKGVFSDVYTEAYLHDNSIPLSGVNLLSGLFNDNVDN
jgi:hypothetical protein